MTPTRFPPLGLDRIGKDWSFYDCTDKANPVRVGPIYKTKAEALADLTDYAARAGWTLPDIRPRDLAASAMLAALQQAAPYVEAIAEQDRENDIDSSETQAERDLIDVRAAIAQAKAAGITP